MYLQDAADNNAIVAGRWATTSQSSDVKDAFRNVLPAGGAACRLVSFEVIPTGGRPGGVAAGLVAGGAHLGQPRCKRRGHYQNSGQRENKPQHGSPPAPQMMTTAGAKISPFDAAKETVQANVSVVGS